MKLSSFFLLTALMFTGVVLTAFDGKIICTKAQNIQDQWTGILPGRPPLMPLCTQVVRLEPFSVNVFFSNPEIKDGKVNVTGKLKMINPAGNVVTESQLQPQTFNSENPKSVFLFPDYLAVSFDPPDATGEYTFIAELQDLNGKKSFTDKTTIKLDEKISAEPSKEPMKAISNYYTAPAPQNIIPGFSEFLKMLPELKAKQKNKFNPISILALFYYALQANPQLHGDFAKLADSLKNQEEKLFAVIIVHELGEKTFALLSKESQAAWNPHFADTFKVGEKITTAYQLDILWSEFFITGKKAPIEKIVREVKQAADNLSPENYKKIAQPTQKDKESLMHFLNSHAAAWSIGSNAKRYHLVAFYLEAMLARNEIKDNFTNAVISKKLEEANASSQKPTQAK